MKFCSLITLLFFISTVAHARWSVSAYNIRNFDRDPDAGQTNIPELIKIIKEVKSDVMAFEEVVNAQAFDSLIKNALPGYSYKMSSCGGYGKQKVAVSFNPATFEFISLIEDFSFSGKPASCGSLRPVLLVTLKHKASGEIFTFATVHLKAGGDITAFQKRWQQYEMLESLSKSYANKNLILLGDFNTTGYNIKNEDYVKFEDFITQANLRTMSETLTCTSYWTGTSGTEKHESSILDHIIIQDKNVNSVASIKTAAHCVRVGCRNAIPQELGVSYLSVSDHCPVQLTFK